MNNRRNRHRILISIFFWMLLLAVNLLRVIPFLKREQIWTHIETISITFSLDLITFSIFYFWLIPVIIEHKKWRWNVLFTIFYSFVYGVVWGGIYYLFGRIETLDGFLLIYKSSIGHTFLHILYAVVLYLSVDWYFKWKSQQKLEQENAKIKLSLLKAQINPHFLFNVLNNIHSLTHKDPVKTSESIIMLSEIMRYMLYESDMDRVLLNKEIEHIHNYLNLQKLRLIEPECVNFVVEGNVDGILIAPLIFIAFVENAFKHGQKNVKNSIRISIKVVDNRLLFYCRNLIRILSETEKRKEISIGLENIKRRLNLLYSDKQKLQMKQESDYFEVQLEIELK